MMKLTGGQAVVESLRVENTSHLFGLIGSATMEIFDALYDADDIRFIGVHDERTGAHMADGYARASGKPGVVLAGQNGPGATNLVTGLAQAKAAFSPVVSIAGALSGEHVYRDAFQEVDQQALFTPVTKRTWTVTQTSRIPETFRDAFRVSMAHQRGPVQINLPRDVLSGSAEYPKFQAPPDYRSQSAPAASPHDIAKAIKLLGNARQPVIIAGGGIKNSRRSEETIRLAELLNAPIVTSPGHGDAIPFDHQLNAGQMGPRGNPVASGLVKNADVILALGTRLGFNSTFYSYEHLNEQAHIIQVELEPTAIGRYFPASLGIWADAPTVAGQIRDALRQQSIKQQADAWYRQFADNRRTYLKQRDGQCRSDRIPDSAFRTLSCPSRCASSRCDLHDGRWNTVSAGNRCAELLENAVSDHTSGFRIGGVFLRLRTGRQARVARAYSREPDGRRWIWNDIVGTQYRGRLQDQHDHHCDEQSVLGC